MGVQVAAPLERGAHVGQDKPLDVDLQDASAIQQNWRNDQPLLPYFARVSRHRARLHATNVRVVCARRDIADVVPTGVHSADQEHIRQMSAGDEGIIDDKYVSIFQCLRVRKRRREPAHHRTQVDGHVLRLRHQLRVAIKYRARGVHALLDIGRESGAAQHCPHFLCRRI